MESTVKNYYILGAIAIIIIVGAVYSFSSPKKESLVTAMDKGTTVAPATKGQVTATIFYTNQGFSPATIEVAGGTKVIFTNQSDEPMWVASATHPAHQILPSFDGLEGIPNGSSYEYTFSKAGAWRYHDHLNPAMRGLVTVK